MLRLHYTGDSVLVADQVGDALVEYARALADAKTADVVVVPVVVADGRVEKAEFLLGPASQLYLTPAQDVRDVDADGDVVADLKRRTRNLQTSVTFSPEAPPTQIPFDHDAS